MKAAENGAVSKRLVIALNIAVLLVLAGGTVAYGALSKTVTVDVDGRTDTVRTFGASVASILESQDVDVEEADEINARPSEQVSDGDTIKVRYAKPVTVAVDGETQRSEIPAATVGEALEHLEVTPDEEAFVSDSTDTLLDRDGDRIVVSNPKELTIEADGKKQQVTTAAPTAEAVLEEAGIDLDADDEVSNGRSALVEKGQTLKVTRIEMVDKTEEVSTDAPVEYRDDDSMEKGTQKVLEEGQPGKVRERVLLTTADGKQRHRLVLTSETLQKAAPRIIARGTAEPEAPSVSAPSVAGGSVWDRIAECESGGNWSINTGNGYYGGLQFSAATWRSVGGPGLPHQHSREVQIKYAEILQKRSGWGQWSCAAKVGVY